ncbi:MAG: DedA family protein [Candidatus Omnitrophica bacterium]|nr:DedA family protein [Candidatus Omnitrophota bacterium]
MASIIDLTFHFDRHLAFIIQHFGMWTYLILFLVIFAETGLVVTPFLPGDSLLFVVGAFSAAGAFHPLAAAVVLILAAVIGDSANYAIGRYLEKKLVDADKIRFINKKHLDKTHEFFKKYGGKTIILARFVPIVRTFAPFVAGFGYMDYPKFFFYNVTGGILWVAILVTAGFCFGNMPIVKDNLSFVILIIIFVSMLPAVIELIKTKRENIKNKVSNEQK